jgi:hypothetical protein
VMCRYAERAAPSNGAASTMAVARVLHGRGVEGEHCHPPAQVVYDLGEGPRGIAERSAAEFGHIP